MADASSTPRALSGRDTLRWLIAISVATIILLAGAIWLELPQWLASTLFFAAVALALVTAACAGRTVADSHAALPWRKRPGISGRTVGVLVFVGLGSLAFASSKLVYPRSWPTNVDDAVVILSEQLDATRARELAYISYDDLTVVQDTLGASVREQFGLNERNARLAYDCDPEYMNPHACSSIIVSRLWKKLRAELPEKERVPLEALEKKMEQIRLPSKQFQDVPLRELTAFFNEEIRRQLRKEAWFEVTHDAAHAEARVTTAWHAMDTISLREALGVLAGGSEWRVRKAPPNLVIEKAAD
jgi:hypothetical protein